ncbi:hypothetical protein [uncultured Hyphomicrobium sp.]|uniref:hypothetical protein n=1 Tax=uncultured Hyphomicrobium sp. TaxID=194373 RepID=UPI0025D03FC3|nr:hypothetical protein [uncultured Hyphomicrobium sp.]
MESAKPVNSFSIAKDGKYHDATYSVDGDVVSVIYWGSDGVTRQAAQAEDVDRPEQTACQLLSQMIDAQPSQFS